MFIYTALKKAGQSLPIMLFPRDKPSDFIRNVFSYLKLFYYKMSFNTFQIIKEYWTNKYNSYACEHLDFGNVDTWEIYNIKTTRSQY